MNEQTPASPPPTQQPTSSFDERAAAFVREPLQAAMAQAAGWLSTAEELQRVHVTMTHLARKRFEEWQVRADSAHSLAEVWAMPLELGRFELAALLRMWQEMGDVAVNAMTRQGEQATEALSVAASLPWPPVADAAPWLAFVHTGIRPIDDLFSAALNKDLVPPTHH